MGHTSLLITEKKQTVVDVGDSDEDMYGGNTDSGEDTEDEIRKYKI